MEGGHVPQDCRMAMDYINDKQFISEVKKFPNLYNAKLPSYTKRAKRRDAWASIAKSFGLQGLGAKEACEKKWKYYRDRFVKEDKRLAALSESGSSSNASAWHLYEHLKFLKGHIKDKRTPSYRGAKRGASDISVLDLSVPSENEPQPLTYVIPVNATSQEGGDATVALQSSNTQKAIIVDSQPTDDRNKKRQKLETSSTASIPPTQLRHRIECRLTSPCHSSDPDELFMLSLVPELKKVSSEEKFECKCELMQVLAKRLQGSKSNEGTRDSVG